jgi:hypothetical protein
MCNVGFELFTEDGTSEYYVPGSETGLRDGDTYRMNKTCVRKMCPGVNIIRLFFFVRGNFSA